MDMGKGTMIEWNEMQKYFVDCGNLFFRVYFSNEPFCNLKAFGL
jgi:hypothetical protein